MAQEPATRRSGLWLAAAAVVVLLAPQVGFAAHVPTEVTFGRVMRLLETEHPKLDLSEGSFHKRFTFTMGNGPKMPPAGLRRFPAIGGYIQATVVRNDSSHAVVLLLPEGDCAYYTFDGKRGFLALVDGAHPRKILYSVHGGIVVYGLLTKRMLKHLNLSGSEMFMVTSSDRPRMFLRLFSFIKDKMAIADDIHFQSFRSPILDIGWLHAGAAYSMHIGFNAQAGAVFPIRDVDLILRKNGHVETTGWIKTGNRANHSPVVIHRVSGLRANSGLPWMRTSVARIFSYSLHSVYVKPKDVSRKIKFLKLRRRFIRWVTTKDPILQRKDRGK